MNTKKSICLIILFCFLLVSCGKHDSIPESGIGDIEPPHYTQESDLVKYLEDMKSDRKIDCYYKVISVPDILTFSYIRPQNIYIGWFYSYSDADAGYPYFTWTIDNNGQERLESAIGNEKLQRIENTDYYYSMVPNVDWPDIEAICAIEWVKDDYNFRLNIPVKYVANGNTVDIDAVNKYTLLEKIAI